MGANLASVSRAKKREITNKLRENLAARAAKGPRDERLDAFVADLDVLSGALDTHVVGKHLASAQRTASFAELDAADDDVDRWYRHNENYVRSESVRRHEVHIQALALHAAAFPEGLAHIDDPIADENRICRASLVVLRSTEYANTLAAIAYPMAWLDEFDRALTRSEGLYDHGNKGRVAERTYTSGGKDADDDWAVLMVQLRRYVASRAKPSEKALIAEGKALLAPLLDELARLRAVAATRATLRAREKENAEPDAASEANATTATNAEPAAPPAPKS